MQRPLLVGLALLTGCVVVDYPTSQPPTAAAHLHPVDNLREAGYVPRSHPKYVTLSADERLLFVALEGQLVEPGRTVAVIDTETGEQRGLIEVGTSPQGMALGRDGALLYVANQFSNYLSVVDTQSLTEVGRIPVSYYAQRIALSADGQSLYVTNRFLDAVQLVTLDPNNPRRGAVTRAVPVGTNPRDVLVGPGGLLYVGNLGATSISLVDPASGQELDRLYTNSPINGLATNGQVVFVATLGRGDGHTKAGGVDPVRGAYRGDSTASAGFSDINNDVMVISSQGTRLQLLHRYTSDTAEVSMPDVVGDYLPAEMIVPGAFPEQMTVVGQRLYVTMSSSDQVATFDIQDGGALALASVADTGINPFGLAITASGARAFTADRLGETVSRIELATNTKTTWWVGASTVGYPANDYELGEMLFHSAKISSEALPSAVFPDGDKAGDKSCNHCHIEGLTDGKVWTVGVGRVVPVGGERMPPSARNITNTSPMFWEGTQQKEDFDLETNEFTPAIDFGCDREATEADPESCLAREAFYDRQVGLTFRQVGREKIGLFLVGRSRLLPNPNAQDPAPEMAAAITRGRALFTDVGCAECHPSDGGFTNNRNLPPVISGSSFDNGIQFRDEIDGNFNVPSLRGAWDRPSVFFHDGRARSLKSAILPRSHVALASGADGCMNLADYVDQFQNGVPRPVLDGRGCNEVGGMPDTHGRTSQLSAAQVDDLLAFVRSIE